MVKQQQLHTEELGCVLPMPVLNGPEAMENAMKSMDEDGKDSSSSSSSLPIHVVVVDDSPIDRKIIEKLLTKAAAYKVTAVDSGRKALEVLDSVNNNIDLIFTDYCMPEMSGYKLLRQIKESNVYGDIPVVIMSSENVPSRIERCLKDGAEEFILKPVRAADARRLSSFVHNKPLKLQSTVEQPPAVISKNKRKFSTDGFQAEARLRLSGVIVA